MSTPTKVTLLSGLLGTLFVVGAAIAPAQAQEARTWVSGMGDDSTPCTRTAPCKTWARALTQTGPGGEIDALDPGGFGVMTITQSITIDGGGGMVAETLTEGTAGIVINASPTDVVVLRNIRFNGVQELGTPGTIGIQVLSAARVSIENNEILGFGNTSGQAGIAITPSSGTINVNVQNTSAYNNQVGLLSAPSGGATINLTVEHSHFDNNRGGGVRIDGTSGGTTNAAIDDTSMSLNAGNGIVAITSTGGASNVDMRRDVVADNAQSGVEANNSAGGSATVTVGSSILSYNVVGAWNAVGSPTLSSFKNNQVTGPAGSTPGTASFQ